MVCVFFFFNDTATTEIYTLSLHDALPICADDVAAQPAVAPAPAASAAPPEPAAPAATETDTAAASAAPPAPKASGGERIFASPPARRIAAQNGIDLSQITGSGPRGRIVKADVDGAPKTAEARPQGRDEVPAPPERAAPAASGPATDTVLAMYQDREFEEVTLDGMRKTIAARLTEAKQTIPHFYLRRDIQLDALMKFRSQLNKQLVPRGVKLSVNDFVIKACALALQQVPDANAVWAGDKTLKLKPSDVAVAVAIEGGLFTPVLKDAEMKSLSALSAEMKDLASRARDRKLAPHEYQGGTFSVSNLGMFGITSFSSIVNQPQGAIMSVGAGEERAVVRDGQIVPRTMMTVTLTCDHRVVDGAVGAAFLAAFKTFIEEPATMLL